jgi:hypothetical protein
MRSASRYAISLSIVSITTAMPYQNASDEENVIEKTPALM